MGFVDSTFLDETTLGVDIVMGFVDSTRLDEMKH